MCLSLEETDSLLFTFVLKKLYFSIFPTNKCSFMFLLLNYEKSVHAHNYRFFLKVLCFNYLISTL